MKGFSDLLKTQFGDSTTPLLSPLAPRLKVGQDAATVPSPPESFETPVGERRVPREKNPQKPSYEMIKDARQGILSGFLQSGTIVRASDLIGMVNPKTAVITLNNTYDFETRFLTAISDQPIAPPPMSSAVSFRKPADQGADDEKTLRNLFYISLNRDELPSFHFWTKAGDLDPVTAGGPFDWGKYFDNNPPSPATLAKIAVLEKERAEKGKHRAEGQHDIENQQPLAFLNPYSSKEPTGGRPDIHTDPPGANASPASPQAPVAAEVLLQFNRGGMYLREFTHKALYAMACWLVKNEEEEDDDDGDGEDDGAKAPTEPPDIFLDILEHGKNLREEKVVSVSPASNRNFREKIKPFLGQPDTKFRIRSSRYPSSLDLNSGFDSSGVGDMQYDLKLVRPNVGYCYCSANWHIPGNLGSNSVHFENAIKFLFDWELSAHPKSNHLSLDIPKHGSFDLDRDLNIVIDAKVQKIFAELSETPAKAVSHPAEIFIRDVVEDDTDGSEFLGTSQHNGRNSMGARDIRGSPDLPSIQPRLLTVSETNSLKERLKIAEAYSSENDDLQEQLRVKEGELSKMNGFKERLRILEERAKLPSSCPFCSQDWVGVTREKQKDHLRLHQRDIVHQPAEQECPKPDCTTRLGENQRESTYEAISEHLRSHIEEEHAIDGICEYQGCHTNMYSLTAEQQEEHETVHRDNQKIKEERDGLLERITDLEESVEKQNRMQEQVGSLEESVKEREVRCSRLQQELEALQGAVKERDQLQEEIVHVKEERDSLQKRTVEMESRLKATSDLHKGIHAKEAEPETEVDEDPKQPNPPEVSRLRYCNVCLKSVDKMSANAKVKHAEKCSTSVSEFVLYTPAEAKTEREKRTRSREVVTSQAQEGMDEGAGLPDTTRKGKQKASAKAAPSKSQQEETQDANTNNKPEARKPIAHQTLKRKNDTFKPSKEDESEDEPELPKKKPKLKTKAAKNDTETAPTRRSARNTDIYQPSKEDEEEEVEEEAYDEPSSSARGGKRKKKAATVTTVTKKVKTKK